MQSLGARVYTIISAILFIVSVFLRLGVLQFAWSTSVNWAFYAVSFFGILFTLLESLKHNGVAFDFKNHNHLNLFSYACAGGFFINFIQCCIELYKAANDSGYKTLSGFIPICVMCIFALISCVYFIIFGISFSDSGYDFRKFKLMHLVPLIWSGSAILSILSKVFSLKNDVDDILKCVALIFILCFFYFFASEVENDNTVKKATVIFSGAASYACALLFFDKMLLIFTRNVSINGELGAALTVLLFSLFAYFFKRSISTNSVLSNEV